MFSDNHSSNHKNQSELRRQRLHELLIALIHNQENLELMDSDTPSFDKSTNSSLKDIDPAKWLDDNQRILRKYQSLVRSVLALDALLESEKI